MAHGLVVASEGSEVAAAGAYALQIGGNAVDAAITAAFAQCVANPLLCGLGGTGEMLVYTASERDVHDIDFGATVPRRLPPDLFALDVLGRDETIGRYAIEGEKNQMGYLSVMVPSFVKGMEAAYLRFASRAIPWDQLLLPAVRLARQGVYLNEYLAQHFRTSYRAQPSCTGLPVGGSRPGYPLLQEKLQGRRIESQLVFPQGQERQPGSLLIQPDLGDALSEIAVHGAAAFYTGSIARRIAEDFAANQGYIDERDLAMYQVRITRALELTTRRGSLRFGAPPSAGMQLAQMIALVEHLGLPLTHNSSEYVDLLARIMQVVFHDQRFVKTWRPEVSPTWDTYLSRHHIAALAADVQARRRTRATSSASGTTHVTTCDDQGNAVSMTHSIGSIAGAGVMTPGLGFFYNNFLGHLNPSPGSPDSIYPGARIGSLCPAIWTHGGSLRLAWGSPGGSRLTTSALQTLLNHVWLGFPIQTAVLLPRFHAEEQHVIHIEPPFEAAARQALHDLGYRLVDSTLAGVVQAIAFGGGTPIPGADARGGMGVAVA